MKLLVLVLFLTPAFASGYFGVHYGEFATEPYVSEYQPSTSGPMIPERFTASDCGMSSSFSINVVTHEVVRTPRDEGEVNCSSSGSRALRLSPIGVYWPHIYTYFPKYTHVPSYPYFFGYLNW